jgi:uncharacterized cupredoxin-like copper-binding protein
MPDVTDRRISNLALALALVLVSAGCGADGDATAADLEPAPSISVVGTDGLAFEPAAHAVQAGDAIELVLRSESGVEHDLIVEGAGDVGSAFDQGGGHSHDDDELVPEDLHVAHALAGEEARSLFTISEPGTYEVYCSIPGHREAGMVGTLVVVE